MSMPLLLSAPMLAALSSTNPCGMSHSDPSASRCTRLQKVGSAGSPQVTMIRCEPITPTAPFSVMSNQSAVSVSPRRKRGSRTRPMALVVAVSGSSPRLPPPMPLYPNPESGCSRMWPYCAAVTPLAAHCSRLALGVRPAQGSTAKLSWNGNPYSSCTLGARTALWLLARKRTPRTNDSSPPSFQLDELTRLSALRYQDRRYPPSTTRLSISRWVIRGMRASPNNSLTEVAPLKGRIGVPRPTTSALRKCSSGSSDSLSLRYSAPTLSPGACSAHGLRIPQLPRSAVRDALATCSLTSPARRVVSAK